MAAGLTESALSAAPVDETGANWLAATPSGLMRSQNGGDTWQPVASAPPLVGLAAIPRMGLVWGVSVNAIFASEDRGMSWTQLPANLPGRAQAFAVGPGLLFLGTDRGIFSSDDGGQSWTNRNGSVNGRIDSLNIQAVAYDSLNDVLYAGTVGGLSFLNLDAPKGWGQRSLQGNVTALALSGANNQELWLGTATGQLFRSGDRGVGWK